MGEKQILTEEISYQDLYNKLVKLLNYFNKNENSYKYLTSILIRKKLDSISIDAINDLCENVKINENIKKYLLSINEKIKILLDKQNVILLKNIKILERIKKVKLVSQNKGINASNLNFISVNKFNTLSEMIEYEKNIDEISKQLERFEEVLGIKEIKEEIQEEIQEKIKMPNSIQQEPNQEKQNNIKEKNQSETQIIDSPLKSKISSGKVSISGVTLILLIGLILISIAITIYMYYL